MSILIADEAATLRRVLRNIIEKADLGAIVEARSGSEALLLLQQRPSRLVIIGASLGDMSGPSLTRSMRSSPEMTHLPVILVASRSYREDVLDALDSGVTDYLVMPFTDGLLIEKIRGALGRTEQERARGAHA
jgi:two-component system, chemotaxis family, chemotaxis protein CheY